MEAHLKRLELLDELGPMQGIVERRTTIPVLSHLLLKAAGDRLEVAATDLDVSLTSWCEAEVKDEGSLAVQARKLYEIVRASEGEEVVLRLDQPEVLTLLAGRSRFKIHGKAAEDFPTLPGIEEGDALEIPFGLFRAMIGKIFFAISSEESRFQLSGALLERKERLVTLVATDGHRLALVDAAVEGATPAAGVLVPRKALQELQRFDDEASLRFAAGEHHLSFTVGRRRLICRILEGKFPDYEPVIAKDHDKNVVADRKTLADVIHRVSLLTGDRVRGVRMLFESGRLVVSAANPDLGEAVDEMPCEYEGSELSLGLNPDYLRDFLAATDSRTIRLELRDESSQCVAYPVEGPDERYVCVIMPIRI